MMGILLFFAALVVAVLGWEIVGMWIEDWETRKRKK